MLTHIAHFTIKNSILDQIKDLKKSQNEPKLKYTNNDHSDWQSFLK